jgi:dipeptidyl aminopeptidase/acylaminoacyl peptidase
MRAALLFWVAVLLLLPSTQAETHPFTFEDMMKLKRVGEPVPSPDGKWVLFSAVDVDLATNKKTPHIWIVPLNVDSSGKAAATAHQNAQANSEASPGMTSAERVLIPDQDGDRPRWAPDGKRFAFISNKTRGAQVWIADFDGSSGTVTGVRMLTIVETEAGGELWSPDGKNILFTSDVYPECDGAPKAEDDCNRKKLEDAKQSKVKALIFEHLLYRHWNAYKEGKRSHIFVVPVPAEIPSPTVLGIENYPRPHDLTPGDYDAPVFSLGGQDNYAFSPDGQELCYTSNHDRVEAASTNNDLWTVPVTWPASATPADILAKTQNITADNPASDSTPLYSSDGKYIAYRAQQRPGYESDRFRLMLYDRKTGEKKNLTENFDQWVESIAWAPNSRSMYFSSGHKGHSLIYAIDIPSTTPKHSKDYFKRTLIGGFNDDIAVTADGKTLVFSRMSFTAPNEIYAAEATGEGCPSQNGDVDAGKESCSLNQARAVTRLNEPLLSQIEMSKGDSFTFKGAKQEEVEGFLVKPPNFDPSKKYPLKFIIHGGPEVPLGDEWSYRWNAELFAAPTAAQSSGYIVIEINFHGSPGYGQKFTDSINGDWGGAPFEDLMKGLDYAEAHYGFIDKDRECALGASYGGFMANWVLGHTDRFKCIVSHDGMFNTISAWGTTEELWFNNWEFKGTPYTNPEMYEKWNPRNSALKFKTPTLVIHSQLDYRLDVSEGFQLFDTLQVLGVPSKMLYFPDEGHWVLKPQNSQLWYKTVNDWVDQWVGERRAK